MNPTIATFDYARFYAELDRIRQERGLTWYGIFRQTHITMFFTPSKFLTMKRNISASTLAKICTWSGLNPDDFVIESEAEV